MIKFAIISLCLTTVVYLNPDEPQVTTETIVYGSGEPILEVTCWAYLYINQRLSWYQYKGSNTVLLTNKIQDSNYGYVIIFLQKTLELNDIGTQIFCVHETVDWDGNFEQKSQSRRISINRQLTDVWGPFVNPGPENINKSSLIEYTCSAYLYKRELLTWFQIKDPHAPIRIKIIQQSAKYGKIENNLRKPLEASDFGTRIYCAKEIVQLWNGRIKYTHTPTKCIHIKYRGRIQPVEKPYVTIEPEDHVIIFDEDDVLKLNCSGSAPVDGRSYEYMWYRKGPDLQQYLPFHQDFDKSTNSNNLQLKVDKSYHRSLLYCAQDYKFNLVTEDSNGTFGIQYGELARSNTIRLLHRTQGDSKDKPQVTPESFEDQRKPFINFTCYAFLLPWEVLSWYQSRGSHSPESLVRTIQLQNSVNGQWMKLSLNKNLDQSDNGSNLYCAKQSVLLNGNYSEEFRLDSQPILLSFQRDVLPLNDFIDTYENNSIWKWVILTSSILLGIGLVAVAICLKLRCNKLKANVEEKKTSSTQEQFLKVVLIDNLELENDTSTSDRTLVIPNVVIETQALSHIVAKFPDCNPSPEYEYVLPRDLRWDIDRRHLTLSNVLGQGEFGKVVKAEYFKTGSGLPNTVAVKMLKVDHSDSDLKDLVSEVEIMKMVGHHENIINLVGCCTHGGPLYVVVEYAANGCLRDYLRKRRPGVRDATKDKSLKREELVEFILQVAKGMEYLAARGCIHRDLAARNVLVSGDRVLKVADFGMARDLRDRDYYRKRANGKVPVRWMAPESLGHNYYSMKSDVWSFGVLMWETLTLGGSPYKNVNAYDMYNFLQEGKRMGRPTNCSAEIYEMMLRCWEFDPDQRPTFSELRDQIAIHCRNLEDS